MKLHVSYTLSNLKSESKVARVFRVAPFGIPAGIPQDTFSNAGELLVGIGGGLYAVLPAPAQSGLALLSDLGQSAYVRWGTPAISGMPATGWSPAGVTWTYVSATSFKIIGVDLRTTYTKGIKIWCNQSGSKFFYCLGSTLSGSDTVVTVTGGSDYSLANAAITDPYYSYVQNPQGFPDRFAFSSKAYGSAGSIGTYAENFTSSYFSIDGKMCNLEVIFRISDKGSWSGDVQSPLPVSCAASQTNLYGAVIATGSLTYKGIPGLTLGNNYINWQAQWFGSKLNWSSIAINDCFIVNGRYYIG